MYLQFRKDRSLSSLLKPWIFMLAVGYKIICDNKRILIKNLQIIQMFSITITNLLLNIS